ncbi:unnamed protein product [Linum tenue]|uniref:Cellulose synthase n=1 Tax=Linum tenue TaxID=586396 RepID=A0AAV0RIS9_9ROSI|nr:unnamed protein product [Linum tenue]
MNTGGRLIAGSHNRNEFVLINADENARIRSVQELSGQVCQICGDEIEITVDGELFVACNECAFPVCRPCYEYERREGTQACPQCRTRYKRLKGSPRVEGDEEEDDIDDLEHEFDFEGLSPEQVAELMLAARLNTGRGSHLYGNGIPTDLDSSPPGAKVPLLTYGEEDADISSDRHALIVPPHMGHHANRVHPVPYSDPSIPLQPRPMVPQKDIAVYGYGSVAWKDRMEEWKRRQSDKLQVVKHEGANDGGSFDGNELDDPDLPMMDEGRQPLSRKLPIPSSKISPYRLVIIVRLAVVGLFFHYRILHPVKDAYALWLTSVICEIWFAVSWILDQFPKWCPIERETYLDRLSLRYEKEGKPSQLASVDVFVSTVDPLKEPPLITANTVFLGQSGVRDVEGNELPRLVYVSREKRPGFEHHKKAGAMNALVRVSAVLSNAPYMLNVDCDHYINNSKALREAMCFMMDPTSGKKVCYVQFPQRFDGIDRHDRYSNRNVVFFDINMKGLDGLQGPIYVGTGCVFRRHALYGYDAPVTKKPPGKTCNCWPKWCCLFCGSRKKKSLKAKDNKKSKNRETSKQIHALENIEQGIVVIQVGWIYGSVTEDILTGFKMHCHGWRSVYCIPKRPAFKGSAPINLSDRLHQVLRWALGSVEIFFSRHCPIWYGYGGGLKWLERFSYINSVVYPWTSLPLLVYCTLPAICLLTGKFIVPEISNYASIVFMALFISIAVTSILEMQWGGVGLDDLWRNEQFWVIGGVSSHLFALFQGLLKVLAGVSTNFTVTSKAADDGEFSELYIFKWTSLLVPPTTLLIMNVIGVVVGISDAINNGYDSWGPLFGRLFFAIWVIVHLYPFLKGLLGKQNKMPTIILVWSILLSSILTLLWVRVNPFVNRDGPVLEVCGLNCN